MKHSHSLNRTPHATSSVIYQPLPQPPHLLPSSASPPPPQSNQTRYGRTARIWIRTYQRAGISRRARGRGRGRLWARFVLGWRGGAAPHALAGDVGGVGQRGGDVSERITVLWWSRGLGEEGVGEIENSGIGDVWVWKLREGEG
jgi:hypothetical protein